MRTEMSTLTAYHGDPAIKDTYLTRVRAHRAADELVQGYGYWQNGKGCAVGCTIHGQDHSAYERELGIPRILAYLEDRLFERMPVDSARMWPERFLDAIPVGADLSLVWPRLAVWLLVDPEHGVVKYATEKGAIAIRRVAELYSKVIAGKAVTLDEWREARAAAAAAAAAYAAADTAADAAAYTAADADAAAAAAAAAAAYTAADAAAYAAADAAADADAAAAAAAAAYTAADAAAYAAADAAAAAAAAAAAYAAAYAAATVRQSEKLLELMAAAPVLEVV